MVKKHQNKARPASHSGQSRQDSAAPIQRHDGWSNVLTGIGLQQFDKRMSTTYVADRQFVEQELSIIYRGDAFARRIIDYPAVEMTREWLEIEGDTDGLALGEMERVHAKDELRDCIRWSRLYGGGLTVMGLDDGNPLDMPVYIPGLRRIAFLKTFDRFRVNWSSIDLYTDPAHPLYGKPQWFFVTPISGSPFRVHESRTLMIDGVTVPDNIRLLNQGWGDSVLQTLYNTLRRMAAVYDDVELIVDEFIQGVLKVEGLRNMMATEGGENQVIAKAHVLDMTKHISNTAIIDSAEEYTKITSTVSGLPEVIDRYAQALAGASGFPVTLLLGRSPAGLNATGDSDIRNWYDRIAGEQDESLTAPLTRLINLIYAQKDGPFRGKIPKDGGGIIYKPLWQLSDVETSALRKTIAETDKLYIDSGVLSPEEVALSRFGGETYSMETVIDVKARGGDA